ncbi:P-II family nitrogen regulator [Candidatus Weimeria sp. HCP3S3_B5]|uniref:P-II family nitrogen regulator n=1 Tax=Candidatus Weimeria sp. HCP3S3_B5 TaxID=3438871 RepID=UPI00307278A4|nr:P-II family nitrogen regulator [Lachnospiraceae bacterium]
MKKIEIITRPEKLGGIKNILLTHDCEGLTVLSVMGSGKQRGYIDEMHFSGEDINLLPKILIFTVVEDDKCDGILADIATIIGTGKTGDGKVFITDIEDAMRIRTSERGLDAIN